MKDCDYLLVKDKAFFHKLYAFIILTRPNICILGFTGVYFGYWLGIHQVDFLNSTCLIGALIAMLAVAFGNIINDVLDYDNDLIIYPSRPIPSQKITQKEGALFAGIIMCLTMLLSCVFHSAVFILVLLGLSLLIIYDLWVKKLPFFGNLVVAILSLLPIQIGNTIAGKGSLPIPFTVALLMYILAREIFNTIYDGPGDLAAGRYSVFICFGKKTTQIFSLVIGSIGALLLLFYPIFGYVRHILAYQANIILVLILLGIVSFLVFFSPDHKFLKPQYKVLLTYLMRSIFIVSCISFVWTI